jgi:trimethylamine corrinoid protein
MDPKAIVARLKEAIVAIDEDRAVNTAQQAVTEGIDPLMAIEEGLQAGIQVIGDKFERLECFLPELMQAAKAFKAAMDVLEPEIAKQGAVQERRGVVVVGTVKGDIHKIGKDIVALLLKTRGFEVHDLGEDVPASGFMRAAMQHKADIIGLSALLNTTMTEQQEVLDLLREEDLRDRYMVILGGAPVSQAWADEIGADAYAQTAEEGVNLALQYMADKK